MSYFVKNYEYRQTYGPCLHSLAFVKDKLLHTCTDFGITNNFKKERWGGALEYLPDFFE